jgi:hypothetical protein
MNPCEVRKNPCGTHVLIWRQDGRFQAGDTGKIELFGYATRQKSSLSNPWQTSTADYWQRPFITTVIVCIVCNQDFCNNTFTFC